jgi:hypothetical protein
VTRDETPFAALVGERLSSVEFVVNEYVQLRFDGPTLNAYNPATILLAGRSYRWGEPGYRDALCERICARLTAGWASGDEIVLEFDDGARLVISLREADTVGAEPAELAGPDGLWVWQAGVPGITYFPPTRPERG